MMKYLAHHLPDKISKYIDLFLGGGSMLLYIIQKYAPAEVVGNDINKGLIAYYREVQKNPDAMIRSLRLIKSVYTTDQFGEYFRQLNSEKADEFFMMNKTSFSGIGYNYSKAAYERNFTISSIDKISGISDVIRNTIFSNLDFREIKFPFRNFFIYIDPPYYSNSHKGLYGKNGEYHKRFDHDALRAFVERYAKHNNIMLSYDDCDEVRQMYKDFDVVPFNFTYSMTNTGGNKCKLGKELIIRNY